MSVFTEEQFAAIEALIEAKMSRHTERHHGMMYPRIHEDKVREHVRSVLVTQSPSAAISQDAKDQLREIAGSACDAATKRADHGDIEVTAEMITNGRSMAMAIDTSPMRSLSDDLIDNDLAAIYRAMHAARPKREVTWEEVEQLYTDLNGHFIGWQAGDIENDIKRALQAFADRRGL